MGVLVVDASDVFLASVLHWIDSRKDLRLVGTARTRGDAMKTLVRLRPDLVVVECVMNGADGFQLAREIKALEDAPLVLLTTFHASEAARSEASACGADGFLPKYDLIDGFDELLRGWRESGKSPAARSTTPATPDPRGSRTVPDP